MYVYTNIEILHQGKNTRVHNKISLCVHAQSLNRVDSLCPTNYSPPGSSSRGIPPAILEWVTISCSRGSIQPRCQTHTSCISRQIVYHCFPTGKPKTSLIKFKNKWKWKISKNIRKFRHQMTSSWISNFKPQGRTAQKFLWNTHISYLRHRRK